MRIMNKDELVESTWLSPREAELYIEKVDNGSSIREAGRNIGMSEGQATSTWSSIKGKAEKSERTASVLDL